MKYVDPNEEFANPFNVFRNTEAGGEECPQNRMATRQLGPSEPPRSLQTLEEGWRKMHLPIYIFNEVFGSPDQRKVRSQHHVQVDLCWPIDSNGRFHHKAYASIE